VFAEGKRIDSTLFTRGAVVAVVFTVGSYENNKPGFGLVRSACSFNLFDMALLNNSIGDAVEGHDVEMNGTEKTFGVVSDGIPGLTDFVEGEPAQEDFGAATLW
jgi:hypothetical protein